MKAPAAARSILFKLTLLVAVAGAAYWFGYYHGSGSASAQREPIAQAPAGNEASSRASPHTIHPETGAMSSPANRVPGAPSATMDPAQQESIAELIARLTDTLLPADALAFIKSDAVSSHERGSALRALVRRWIDDADHLSKEQASQWRRRVGSTTGERFGLEVELGLAVAEAGLDSSIKQAWLESYADHPGRSKLFAGLLAEQFRNNPLAVLNESSTWTEWEQRQFERNLFHNWARTAPEAALDWYTENRNRIDEALGNEILNTASQTDPNLADKMLSSIQNPNHRINIIRNVATQLAHTGTENAIDWVDSLQDESERNAALEAVYHATPRGIGAVMGRQDGFPLINALVPGGPLAGSALAPGDMIIQATEAGGESIDLYGMPMGEFVNTLRGEPGSEVEIRVLRRNPETSQLEETQVRVRRDVLIIPPNENERQGG